MFDEKTSALMMNRWESKEFFQAINNIEDDDNDLISFFFSHLGKCACALSDKSGGKSQSKTFAVMF